MLTARRFIAVDWSGALRPGRKIWLARVEGGAVRRLECMQSRHCAACELLAEVADDPRTIIGLDFPFSFPAWFLRHNGFETVEALWRGAEAGGEAWLGRAPFFTKGRWVESEFGAEGPLRMTDRETPCHPETPFKLVGAKQVGKGMIRGASTLLALRASGVAVFPFESPRLPMAVEIFPRVFYGAAVKKSSATERERLLRGYQECMSEDQFRAACRSDDAFDAAVSALEMYSLRDELAALDDPGLAYQLEGKIWIPRSPRFLGGTPASPGGTRGPNA